MQNLKMSFICIFIIMKIDFHINSFALNLTLKQRLEATQKWPNDFVTYKAWISLL